MRTRRGDSQLRHRCIRSRPAMLLHSAAHRAMLLPPMQVPLLRQQDLQSWVDISMRTMSDVNTSNIRAKRVPDTDRNNTPPTTLVTGVLRVMDNPRTHVGLSSPVSSPQRFTDHTHR